MFLITMMIGVIAGLIAIASISHFTKNLTIISLLTVAIIVSAMSLAKIYVVTYIQAATYEYFLKKEDPVCRLIAKTYPTKFDAYIKNIKQVIRNNAGKDTQLFFKIDLLNTIFNIIASKATNDTIYDYYQSELALYKSLDKLDPGLVIFMEFSSLFKEKLNPGLAVLLSGEDRVKDLTAKKEAVIMSALKTPVAPLTIEEKERASELLHDIFTKLGNKFGAETLAQITSNPTNPACNKSTTAAFIIAFYENILSLNKEDVGLVFKYFYKGQSENKNETST